MSGIQRYEPWPQEWPMEDANGDLVTYEDHVKVVEALKAERDDALEWLSASQGYIADAVFALDKQEKAELRAKQLEVALLFYAASNNDHGIIARAALKGMDEHQPDLAEPLGPFSRMEDALRKTLAALKGSEND